MRHLQEEQHCCCSQEALVVAVEPVDMEEVSVEPVAAVQGSSVLFFGLVKQEEEANERNNKHPSVKHPSKNTEQFQYVKNRP